MKIRLGTASQRSLIYESQARFLAKAIRKLEAVFSRQFMPSAELSLKAFQRFSSLTEYEEFLEATSVCGFVCSDYGGFFHLDEVHARPNYVIPLMSFRKLRHYIHTLQRAEKWNSDFSAALYTALTSGALSIVAQRLESDESLYESANIDVDEEI